MLCRHLLPEATRRLSLLWVCCGFEVVQQQANSPGATLLLLGAPACRRAESDLGTPTCRRVLLSTFAGAASVSDGIRDTASYPGGQLKRSHTWNSVDGNRGVQPVH